jgi:hypothetical protein
MGGLIRVAVKAGRRVVPKLKRATWGTPTRKAATVGTGAAVLAGGGDPLDGAVTLGETAGETAGSAVEGVTRGATTGISEGLTDNPVILVAGAGLLAVILLGVLTDGE